MYDYNMLNKKNWEKSSIVKFSSKEKRLQKPEKTIKNILLPFLGHFKMLDIGVGAGRTTLYFAPLVKKYVGIDYSHNMIRTCKEKIIKKSLKPVTLKVCDVKAMKIFKKEYFDFILFSFNGIDYLNHKDRLKALKEIKRVGKRGGYFCFSSHNLNALKKLRKLRISLNPLTFFYNLDIYLKIGTVNKNLDQVIKNKKFIIVNDGTCNWQFWTYYLKPQEQIKQLKQFNFSHIRIFSLNSGREIIDKATLKTIEDDWLYYLCNI